MHGDPLSPVRSLSRFNEPRPIRQAINNLLVIVCFFDMKSLRNHLVDLLAKNIAISGQHVEKSFLIPDAPRVFDMVVHSGFPCFNLIVDYFYFNILMELNDLRFQLVELLNVLIFFEFRHNCCRQTFEDTSL